MRYFEKGKSYLDYYTIRKELNICEAKLIRLIQKLDVEVYRYKNQNLIEEKNISLIAAAILKNNKNG